MAREEMKRISSRVLVVPMPAQGHVPALLTLATRLASHGIPITMANIDSVHNRLMSSWTCPAGIDIKFESVPIRAEIPRSFDKVNRNARLTLLEAFTELSPRLEDLISRLATSGTSIACLISDYHAFWTSAVAAKLNIPQICFWCGSAAWSLLEYHVPMLHSKGFVPLPEDDEEFRNRMIHWIPGMEPFRAADLPFYLHAFNLGQPNAIPDNPVLSSVIGKVSRLNSDQLIILNTFQDLEATELDQMRHLTGSKSIAIGPLLASERANEQVFSLETEDTRCLEWLDKRPNASVLYVSFGSLATVSKPQLEELAMGIVNRSFLWVVRPEFLAASGVSEEFYQGFKSRILGKDSRSMIVNWAPQQKVLAHGAVGGFLTHCGWNSTLESIWNGVPMLAWACHSDQNVNSRLTVEGKGIGRCLPRERREDVVPRGEVEKLVDEVMTSVEMRRRAGELKRIARCSVAPGGSSHTGLQFLIDHLKHQVNI